MKDLIETLAHKALFMLDEEVAHRLALRALSVRRPAPDWCEDQAAFPRLRCSIAGLDLPHPVGLAAGFDKDGVAVSGLMNCGFSFVEVGTVTPEPQTGNAKPRLFRLTADRAIINRYGFNSRGRLAVAENLRKKRNRGSVLGINVGPNKGVVDVAGECSACLRTLYPYADYATINVSSPNTPGLRDWQEPNALRQLLRDIDRPLPIFVKLSPDLAYDQVGPVADVLEEARVAGLIIGNTTTDRPTFLRSEKRREQGGLSGKPLFLKSTVLLAHFRNHLQGRVPLIAAGGISDSAQAYAKVLAGAEVLQVYTGFVYGGPGLVRELVTGLNSWLGSDGHAHLQDAVGIEAKTWTRYNS
jgi:dihydroorotate dehydrogenase